METTKSELEPATNFPTNRTCECEKALEEFTCLVPTARGACLAIEACRGDRRGCIVFVTNNGIPRELLLNYQRGMQGYDVDQVELEKEVKKAVKEMSPLFIERLLRELTYPPVHLRDRSDEEDDSEE